MVTAGLIFSDVHHSGQLTKLRTTASIPFGCRYRLIDFPLSSMVNSGIMNVGVVISQNYGSLLDHIGTGKDWDLSRRSGGIRIITEIANAESFISRSGADVFVLWSCDVVMNLDLSRVIEEHIKSGAYATLVTREGVEDSFTGVMVMSRHDLEGAFARGDVTSYSDFTKKVIEKGGGNSFCYEGSFARITSLESYFDASMKLLCEKDILRPLYTKLRNSAPTRYTEGAVVKNSLIADGCIIEGEVENSVIFRGVRIGRGSKVKSSILLQDTFVGGCCSLNCTVTDKNVIIKDSRNLSGHESMPFFIGKGEIV